MGVWRLVARLVKSDTAGAVLQVGALRVTLAF